MVREQPARPGTWLNLGNALKTVGRTDEAVKALKRATKLQPTLGQAYWTLANFKSYRFAAAGSRADASGTAAKRDAR